MRKLFKVTLGKPTNGESWVSMRFGDDKKIKTQYFVIAKSFNEAGKLVSIHVNKLIEQEKSTIRITEFGMEDLSEEITVCKIELMSDELITGE